MNRLSTPKVPAVSPPPGRPAEGRLTTWVSHHHAIAPRSTSGALGLRYWDDSRSRSSASCVEVLPDIAVRRHAIKGRVPAPQPGARVSPRNPGARVSPDNPASRGAIHSGRQPGMNGMTPFPGSSGLTSRGAPSRAPSRGRARFRRRLYGRTSCAPPTRLP